MAVEITWDGYAGHFICSDRCLFRLCTQVGKYRVSTVGDLYINPEDEKPETVAGLKNAYFETMVFLAEDRQECGCHAVSDYAELERSLYPDHIQAHAGHMEMIEKYRKMQEADA